MCDCSLMEIHEKVNCYTEIIRSQSWIHTYELSTEGINLKQDLRARSEGKAMSLLFLPSIPRSYEDGVLLQVG